MRNIKRYLIYFTICLVSLFVFSNTVSASTLLRTTFDNSIMIKNATFDSSFNFRDKTISITKTGNKTARFCIDTDCSTMTFYNNIVDERGILRYFYQVFYDNWNNKFVFVFSYTNYNNANPIPLGEEKISGGTQATLYQYSSVVGSNSDYISSEGNLKQYNSVYYENQTAYANYSAVGHSQYIRCTFNNNTNACDWATFSSSWNGVGTAYYLIFSNISSRICVSSNCTNTLQSYSDNTQWLFYNWVNQLPNIQVSDTSYRYTEEDNNFIYKKIASITFNEDYVNDNYKLSYEYSDGLEYSKNGVLTGVNDTIDIYVNGTLKIYIKDSQNNLIDSYEQTYSDLGELSQRAAFDSNGNGANIYSLNVHYNFGSMTQYGVMPFRIMYYSNDFSETNTPRLIGFKKYYYDSNNSKKLVNNDFELFDIQDLECRKYSNQVICNGFIINNIPFNNFEIDFLFNHIENYSMHYFDQFTQNFSARDVSALSNDLVGYTKYYFPNNSDRAYIFKKHINQNNKTGSVVFPWFYTERDSINVKAIYYNSNESNNNSFNFLPITTFQNNEYYKKIDYDLTDNEVLTVLVDRVNSCSTNSATQLGSTIAGVKLPKLNITCEFDSAYIFVPNDFIVNFNQYSSNPQDDTYQILTDDDGNKAIVDKEFNYQDFYNQHDINSLFDRITNELNKVKPLTTEFSDTFTRMWNKISPERQSLIITCFCMLVIISIVLMARRG